VEKQVAAIYKAKTMIKVVCTNVHTIIEMAYQWNRDKAAANLRNHGIDFADYLFSRMTWPLPFQMNGLMRNGLSQSVSMHLAELWWLSTHCGMMRFGSSLLAKQLGMDDSSMRRVNRGGGI